MQMRFEELNMQLQAALLQDRPLRFISDYVTKSEQDTNSLDIHNKRDRLSGNEKENGNSGKNIVPEHIKKRLSLLLEGFEKNHTYLTGDLTLEKTAKLFKTNRNYLSMYINEHKDVSFIHYMNTLRISYLLKKWSTDKEWRSYKLEYIASKIGYLNYRSFQNAFKQNTGLSPKYYLEQLEKSGYKSILLSAKL